MMTVGMLPLGSIGIGRGTGGKFVRRAAADAFSAMVLPRRRFMQVNITFRHLEPTEALKAHVRDRIEHVERYVDRSSEAHAVLHVENLHHHAEITVKAGRFLLRGSAKTQDMYASIDAAAEKIERQLMKHKSKLNTFKVNGNHAEAADIDVRHDILDMLEHPDRPSHRVVKSSKFQAKPMSVDEALLQLELLDAHFFVFQNSADRTINVVYRREDGNFGLIEAQT
jgi:putative sigma-54 modulation protein